MSPKPARAALGRMQRGFLCLVAVALLSDSAHAAAVHLPPATRKQLKNGLTVIVVPRRSLPLVHFRLLLRSGSVADAAGKEGTASLCADLLTQGAGGRSAREIAEAIEYLGGSLNSTADAERCVVTCEVLSKDFGAGLELFRDVVVRPTFSPEEFERKRDETLANIANNRNDPSTVADEQFGRFLLGESPLAHPMIGYEKSVSGLKREDVVEFHRRYFVPERGWLAIVGDVDPAQALSAVETAFKEWGPSGEKAAGLYAPVPQVKGRQILIVDKPDATQTQIRMGCIGVARNHPDYFPIMVSRTILSVGFASRLVDRIRVTQGLTYHIASYFGMYRNAGTFTIDTFTKNETIRECIDATLKEVAKLVEEGPSEEELNRAKRFMTGQYPLGLQAPGDLAARLLDVEFFDLDPQYIESYDARVNAVSLADARRALKSYFCTQDLRILLVSNAGRARPAVASLGEVTVRGLD